MGEAGVCQPHGQVRPGLCRIRRNLGQDACGVGEVDDGRGDRRVRTNKVLATHPGAVTVGDPGELRSCAELAKRLPKSCSTVPLGARIRPKRRNLWQIRAMCWPDLARNSANSAEVGRCWPTSCPSRPSLFKHGRSRLIGQIRPNLAKIDQSRPIVGKTGPDVVVVGQCLAEARLPKQFLSNLL